ncbi:MAG: SagB family peptide dehydrogenase [Cyanobacteria bacterium P01_G01_bin.54]
MPWPALLSLHENVQLESQSPDQLILHHPNGATEFSKLPAAVHAALCRLAEGDVALETLVDEVAASANVVEIARLYYHVTQLRPFLLYSLNFDGQRLLTIEPMAAIEDFAPHPVNENSTFQLSRFSLCRRDGVQFIAESPLSPYRVRIHDPLVVSVLSQLTHPSDCGALADSINGLGTELALAIVSYLVAAELVIACDAANQLPEDKGVALRQWEFHDLLFHSRSRIGQHNYPVGASFRFREELPPLPALKSPPAGSRIPLQKANINDLRKTDPSLSEVLEQRRSVRAYGDDSITLEQLGCFLYRVARVRSLQNIDPDQGIYYEQSSRPYPCGGAAYELEFYLTSRTCQGLPMGIYYYDPLHHELVRVNDEVAQVEALLEHASVAAARIIVPQVLVTLTSRFQRLSWKYNAIAYAATLKHVGVLYQTMYLVATAMGLAPCALGSGPSKLATEAMGLDYVVESPVGEFMLGSRPQSEGVI